MFPLVDEAERRVEYLYVTLEALRVAAEGSLDGAGEDAALAAHAKTIAEAEERVLAALDKDLNTPAALAVLGELGKAANEVAMFTAKAKKDPMKAASGRRLARAAGRRDAGGREAARPPRRRRRRRSSRGRAPSGSRTGGSTPQRDRREGDASARRLARPRTSRAATLLRKELTDLGVEVLDGQDGSTWKVTILALRAVASRQAHAWRTRFNPA